MTQRGDVVKAANGLGAAAILEALNVRFSRRRFRSGRVLFETLYRDLVDTWALYGPAGMQPILQEEGER